MKYRYHYFDRHGTSQTGSVVVLPKFSQLISNHAALNVGRVGQKPRVFPAWAASSLAHCVRDRKMAHFTGGETEAQRVTPNVVCLFRVLSSLPVECLILAAYRVNSDVSAKILLRPHLV